MRPPNDRSRLAALTSLGWPVLSVLFVAGWFCVHGYSFGRADQALHLAFLRREMDPTFLANDPFMRVAARHFSFFWTLQLPLLRFIDIGVLYFAIQVLSVWAMLAGTKSLHEALFPTTATTSTALLAVGFAVFSSNYTFGGIPSFDNLVLNRTVVLGGELYALALAVRGRFVPALLLAGLLFNLHPTTALHCGALVGILALVDPKRMRAAPIGALAFVAGAAPLLVKLAMAAMATRELQPSTPQESDATWRLAIELHFPFHHFLAWMPVNQWMRLVLPLLIIILAWRRWASPQLLTLTLATLGIIVVAAVAVDVFGIVRLVPAHLFEVTRFLSFLSYACAGMLLGDALAARRWSVVALLAVYWLNEAAWLQQLVPELSSKRFDGFIMPAIAVVAAAALHVRASGATLHPGFRVPPHRIALVMLVLAAAAVPRRRTALLAWGPAQQIVENCTKELTGMPKGPVDQICGFATMRWIKTSLPKDAMLVGPPVMSHPFTMLRLYGERAVVMTYKDGGEATFDRAYAGEWLRQLEAVSGVAPTDTDTPRNVERWLLGVRVRNLGYASADRARFLMLRERYGATHAIVASNSKVDLPVEHEDAGWKVVRIE